MAFSTSGKNCAVTVITTGGTIASQHQERSGAVVPALSGQELVDSASVSSDIAVTVQELAQLDSSAMTLADIDLILDAVDQAFEEGAQGVVITHGTDSMEETAMAVDIFLTPGRRVVLTGAMRAADDSCPDGPRNLADAIMAAAGDPTYERHSNETNEDHAGECHPILEGTFIAFAGHLTPARGAYKTSTQATAGFASTLPPRTSTRKNDLVRIPLPRTSLSHTDVRIVTAWPGAPRIALDDAVANGAQGLVIEAMGSGNVGEEFATGIRDAVHQGIPVVISTRVPSGPVSGTYGGAGGGATLLSQGAVGSGYLRSPQARVLLAAALACGVDPKEVFADVQG